MAEKCSRQNANYEPKPTSQSLEGTRLGGGTYHITSINSVTDITVSAAYAGTTGTAAYTLKGFQGTGVNAVVYVPGSGCTMLNIETGAMTSDFSTDGTIGITDRWTMHDSFASVGSTYSFVGSTTCLSASCPTGSILPYIWRIGTTTVLASARPRHFRRPCTTKFSQ